MLGQQLALWESLRCSGKLCWQNCEGRRVAPALCSGFIARAEETGMMVLVQEGAGPLSSAFSEGQVCCRSSKATSNTI